MAGALGGARLAASIFPVPVVGPFAGTVLGGIVGNEVGRRFGKAVINGAAAFVDTMRAPESTSTAEAGDPASTTATNDEAPASDPTPETDPLPDAGAVTTT